MEINITWNLCRICLQEQSTSASVTMEINTDMAENILEMTGVMIKSNDSLPQKICKKCLQVLKQAICFRTTCRTSDAYLKNILEKARSFKLDKPEKILFDEIIEESSEDISNEEYLLQDCDSNIKHKESDKNKYLTQKLETQVKRTHILNVIKMESTNMELKHDKKSTLSAENDLLFINEEANGLSDKRAAEDASDFTESPVENKNANSLGNDVEKNNYLQYKSLEASLDSVEEDAQDEMLQSSNLPPVDIVNNDDNDELFFIFSDDVISKADDNDTRDDAILVENISDMVDNIANASDEERNFIELVDSENNTLDPIDCIDESMNGKMSPNNENEDYYEQSDLMEQTPTQYLQLKQKINGYNRREEKRYVIKAAQEKATNFDCQICGNHFNNRSLLKYHMRVIHSRNYECELCGKRFTAACNLTTHMRTHTGEKPFVCQYCNRRFSDKSTHVKHERSHTDERPYSCTVCLKAFTLSSSLKAHKRVHTGEKPYRCLSCGKSFKLPHQLKAHLSTNAHKIRTEEEIITPN